LVGKKNLGKDLQPLIIKAINFINNDVKSHLGIKVLKTPKKQEDSQQKESTPYKINSSYIFGG
jgi:hypothetical protein